MTKSTRNFLALVGAVAILLLGLFAVAPVLAQDGTGGDNGLDGNSVVLQEEDTLGTLVSRYNLSSVDLRSFFSDNAGLILREGQTVTFPEGVQVELPADVQDQGDAGESTGASAGVTSTPEAGEGTTGDDLTVTETPAAGAEAALGSSGQTYVTQSGDALGEVLGFIGFTPVDTMSDSGTVDSDVTSLVTETPDAGAGATEGGMTPTEAPATGAGGDTGADTALTATPATGAGVEGGTAVESVTDDQLQEFVTLNSHLAFIGDQVVVLPPGVP